MQNDMLNRAECIGQAISRIHKREGPFVMFEYVRDADFQFWLQRTFKSLTLCLVSFVAFFILVQSIPNMQFWLYAFFRWILIPVKPLLVMEQSGAVSAGLLFLSNICFMLNWVVVPAVAYLAFRSGRLPYYLCVQNSNLLILRQMSMDQSPVGASILYIGDKKFSVAKTISLHSIENISVERPRGTKSYRDYVLHINADRGQPTDEAAFAGCDTKIRWGDIVKVEDRNRFLNFLEEAYPLDVSNAMFEPFRQAPERQSYTELWLRELSGAPKRDKLTPLAEGAQLMEGRYTVLLKVGVGGQGTVYLASTRAEKESGNLVILKEFVLPVFPDLRVRKRAAERFQTEAAMLSKLNHPQIAQFIDLFIEDHRAYLVLEHVEGTTLKDLIASSGPLPESEVVRLAKQIAEILVYLHGQDPPVIHRDLTPDNIMLGENGQVKLIDFSVAQEVASGVTGSVVGKPNYISPEQFRGKPTAQSDIYSFGATLYYLLIGHDPPPITKLHPMAENEKVSPKLDALISRCTQLDTSKRCESAEQILFTLESCQS